MNTTTPPVAIRRANERGKTQLGWLDSAHSFSFGHYYDPECISFRSLRVINDDKIAAGAGFGEHGHDNMEIISWMLGGALRHGDSLENSRLLRPGEVQVMSAGSGIRHSEFNASENDPAHLIQIWIQPKSAGIEPRYDQATVDASARHNRFAPIASGFETHQAEGALPIHQDAAVFVADLDGQASVKYKVAHSRAAYVHVASGSVELAGNSLGAGDAAIIEQPGTIEVEGIGVAQLILFDLA